MSNEPKLVKVTLEFEDEIRELTGKDATEWSEACNLQATMCHIHGISFPQFSWKTIKKEVDDNGNV